MLDRAGFRVENVFVMAGVPSIMRAMLDGIKGDLRGGQPVGSRTVACNLGEGTIAAKLKDLQARYSAVDIGSYPRFSGSGYRTTVVLRHRDDRLLEAVLEELCELIREQGGDVRVDEEA